MSTYSSAGQLHAPLYYKHSGKFPISSTIFALTTGVIASALLAVAYSYIILYMPLIYINLMACIGFGWTIGWIVGKSLRWGRVRNTGLAVVLAIVVAAVAMYVAWAAYVFAAIQRAVNEQPDLFLEVPTLFHWISHPADLWEVITGLYEEGSWGITSSQLVSGPPLAAVWLAEIGIVFYFALQSPRALMADPYCENCEQWTTPQPGVATLASGDNAALKQQLEARNFAALDQRGVPAEGMSEWLTLDLHQCPECKNLNTLTVSDITYEVKNDKAKTTIRKVMQQFMITPAEADLVRGLAGRLKEAAAAAAQSTEPVGPVEGDSSDGDEFDDDGDDSSPDGTQRPAN